MPVDAPKIFQNMQCVFGKRHESVFAPLGVTNVNPHAFGVDVADRQVDAFAETQAHAVDGEEKDFIAQYFGCFEKPIELPDAQNIWNYSRFWRFYQWNVIPGLVRNVGVKELQTIQVELDGAPGTQSQEFAEVVKQLIG